MNRGIIIISFLTRSPGDEQGERYVRTAKTDASQLFNSNGGDLVIHVTGDNDGGDDANAPSNDSGETECKKCKMTAAPSEAPSPEPNGFLLPLNVVPDLDTHDKRNVAVSPMKAPTFEFDVSRVPLGCVVPDVNVLTMCELWFRSDPNQGMSVPLRLVQESHLRAGDAASLAILRGTTVVMGKLIEDVKAHSVFRTDDAIDREAGGDDYFLVEFHMLDSGCLVDQINPSLSNVGTSKPELRVMGKTLLQTFDIDVLIKSDGFTLWRKMDLLNKLYLKNINNKLRKDHSE
ncbi:Aste57867_19285 [Aphanomyces stellatus]|uniref:Aste57867_19285 protein n=1 Tax=Aphanomyces stellatus TaxID=120398 RepID=A0A485LDM6_9STRA|nr:hypothetical protein As57867_019221 [Aphanomyces stellatus]VFT96005.1 Aste57867_19285 [Aphanomyces stellatus]